MNPAIKPDAVCEFLKHHHQCLGLFLEFLVNEKMPNHESIHTRLALHYINDIADKITNSPSKRMTVNKLRSLLRTSASLDLNHLSSFLNDSIFPHESAIVCGRLGDHTAAINIFVNKLQVRTSTRRLISSFTSIALSGL